MQKFVLRISGFHPVIISSGILKRRYATKKLKSGKGAVVLSGSGHLDGTCMYEAVATAINLHKYGVVPEFFAPKVIQSDVINHATGEAEKECRCAFVESARIARGQIKEISELHYCDYSCVIFPGGFGVAKTLSTYANDRENCSIHPEVMRVLEEFHDAKKPMGFMCISAILPARLFPYVKITLGLKGKPESWPYQDVIHAAKAMGAEVEPRKVDGICFDKQHMVFTTPAFMYNGSPADVFDGIRNLIFNMVQYTE